MKGKIGLVVGLGVGYVLGTRAGRERYEQIKREAQKLWQLDPVQNQVVKVKAFAKSSALALPRAVWTGAVKVGTALTQDGSVQERAERGVAAGKQAAALVQDAAEDAVESAEDAVKARKAAAKPKKN